MPAFRSATPEDFPAICQLITSEEELFLVYPKGKYPLTVAQLESLAEVREQLTVMVEGERVIGFANLYHHRPGQFAYIGNVIVDPHCRGRGLGRLLIEYLFDLAVERLVLPEVRISVFSDNTTALLLYAALGFSPYEIEARINPKGERVALIHMRKRV